MDKPCFYEIRIQGNLEEHWSDWFEGLNIQATPDGETILKGNLPDQAALFGILNKFQALNISLISVNRVSHPE